MHICFVGSNPSHGIPIRSFQLSSILQIRLKFCEDYVHFFWSKISLRVQRKTQALSKKHSFKILPQFGWMFPHNSTLPAYNYSYVTNGHAKRNITDAPLACNTLTGPIKPDVLSRKQFCKKLLLPKPANSSDDGSWPETNIDGPISLVVQHQQVLSQSNQVTHRIWILLGEIHRMETSCPSPSMSVLDFVGHVAQNSGGCSVDLMLEEWAGSISGGRSPVQRISTPMSKFNEFFRDCSNRSQISLSQTPSTPQCYQYIVDHNLRVTYADPRYEILGSHPARRHRETDAIAKLLLDFGNSTKPNASPSFLTAMENIAKADIIPKDFITVRRVRRLEYLLACMKEPHVHTSTQEKLIQLFNMVLADTIPVAIHSCPLMRSQLASLDEPYKTRLVHAHRAIAWRKKKRYEKRNLGPVLEALIRRPGDLTTVQHMQIMENSVTRWLAMSLDVYVISRSLRRWNKSTGADPHTPCVIVVFAGYAHTRRISQLLPALSPTDTIYSVHNSLHNRSGHSTAEQCISLKEAHVQPNSDESVGSLNYFSRLRTHPVPPTI